MKVPVEIDVSTPTINIVLPTNVPLMCDIDKVVDLFGVGKTTINALRKSNPDFPVRQIGRSVWYLVPDLYAWFRNAPDGVIPIE